jgi:hypothetical protein
MRAKLRAYGGSGKLDDGSKVYRLLRGDIYPLGIGFTTTPAADVKGLYSSQDESSNVEIKDKRDKKTYFQIKKPELTEKVESKISQYKNINVKNKKEIIMDIEQVLSELKDLLVEKKFSEEAVANMTSTFADAIKQKDTEYRESLTKADEEKEALAKEREELKASMEEIRKQLADAGEKLTEFEASKKADEALARFNARMESVDQSYDLDDEDRQLLAQELKELSETEEAFASFQNKLSIMWKHKNKEAKAAIEKSIQDKIDEEVAKKLAKMQESKASVEPESEEEVIKEAIENSEVSEAGISSSNEESSRQPASLRDKFAAAFNRENIIIS